MPNGKRTVAIVGVAESDSGFVPNLSIMEQHAQAATRALADSGLKKGDIDGLFTCGGVGVLHPLEIAEYLGMHPRYIDSTSVGGSSWETYIEHAVLAIEAGKCNTALLVYGSTANSDVKKKLRSGDFALLPRGVAQYETPFGITLISKYGMAARRHMHQYGTTSEQLAAIGVAARKNANRNPKAFMYGKPLTIEDVLKSKMVADPLHLNDCCLRTDGGGAVIITRADVAKGAKKKPVWVIGCGGAEDHVIMSQSPDLTISPAKRAAETAFGEAGITTKDVDYLGIYDSFSITVLLTLEALGFCKPGEGGPFVADGKLAWDGALPTNTDGGGLSSNHPGMRGIFLLIEATKQLRGESTAQVKDPKIAVCNGTGGFLSHCGTVVLAKD
jgi:acetyl-CoA acetyltransferase